MVQWIYPSKIESAEYFMGKKYRGDQDTNVDDQLKFEACCHQ